MFIGLVTAAQLGPLLLFSLVGGIMADSLDRRRTLVTLCVQQAGFSILLAMVALDATPNRAVLVATVLCIGIGNALYAPIFSSVVPILVPRRDIAGAISLNSVQMNAARVVGPAIGSTIYAAFGPSWVFLLNSVTFAAVITALRRVDLPDPPASGSQGLQRVLEGFRVARQDRVIGQALMVIYLFSFFCLPFITQLPKIAGDQLGIAPRSSGYGLLYAAFGIGAVAGALSIGTVFSSRPMAQLTRQAMAAFAVMLAVFGSLRSPAPAYVVLMLLGSVYFASITSLSTVLQRDLDDAVRGKVMALWLMGFGGTVPFGGMAGGWVIERYGMTPMFIIGSVVALVLALRFDLQPTRPRRARVVPSGSP